MYLHVNYIQIGANVCKGKDSICQTLITGLFRGLNKYLLTILYDWKEWLVLHGYTVSQVNLIWIYIIMTLGKVYYLRDGGAAYYGNPYNSRESPYLRLILHNIIFGP